MLARGDANALLVRAIEADARRRGIGVVVTIAGAHRWASATFSGMRHDLRVIIAAGPAADSWLADLPEAEFALPGHLVADLSVERVARDNETVLASLGVLTLDEG